MKKSYLLIVLFLFPLFMHAQPLPGALNTETEKLLKIPVAEAIPDTTVTDTVKKSPWIIKNKFVLTAEEAYYSNWQKDGFNSLAFTAIYVGKYNYITPLHRWENTLDMAYGLMSQDFDRDGKLDPTPHPNKTEDRFILTSSYNRKAFKRFYYNATVDFRSQFTETYKDTILLANAFAPAYLLGAIGLNYEYKGLSVLYSPITARTTFVTDNRLSKIGAFGVTPGEHTYFEFGSYLKILYSKEVIKNITVNSKLEFFYDYKKTLFKDTGVNWETMINMKVNKFLSAFFNMQLIYDKKIIDKLQFKEKLGLMVSLDF